MTESQPRGEFDDFPDTTTNIPPAAPAAAAGDTPRDEFPDADAWVREWFAPAVALKITGDGRGLVWCAQWWAHTEVAVRMDALWKGWEVARRDNDKAAMSSWWIQHADHHLRAVCNGESGPMWRCTPGLHREVPALRTVPAPPGWFATGDGGTGPTFA